MKHITLDYEEQPMSADLNKRMELIRNSAGSIVKHFKGNLYIIQKVVRDCDDATHEIVEYKALYGDTQTWVRDLSDFVAELSDERKTTYSQLYRMQLIKIVKK